MTLSPLERHERRQQRRRTDLARRLVLAALVVVVFGLGIALGQALHDNPKPGPSVTIDRTVSLPTGPPGSTVTP